MTISTDQELITEFVVESLEHLADIEGQLLALEAAGADIDDDLVNTVFRAIHSIKGAAGFLGLETIGKLSHSMENLLNLFRNRERIPDTTSVDVLLRSADMLRSLLEQTDTSNDVDVSMFLRELAALVDGDTTPGSGAAPESAVGAAGVPEATDQAGGSDPPAGGNSESAAAESAAAASTTAEPVSAGQTEEPAPGSPQAGASAQRRPAPPATNGAQAAPVSTASSKSGTKSTKAAPDTSIRVSVRLLDHLMNLAGELVLSRNRLVQVVASADANGCQAVAANIDHVTSELQEAIMRTRMQPIGNVFGRFRRVVRDLSVKLEKECVLEVEGEEVEMDKSIIEAIGDPLTHLIRNAVDHGIETPAERAAAGKPRSGTIQLKAFHQAGKVHIVITDDGRGIDADRLKAKAIERGLITAEQASHMSQREAVLLIFHPGFSMAAKVTDVSGRGVGMDVVRSNIEKLSGTIAIETEVGRGTHIDIRLPLTLAIVPSLIIRCANQRFAIPQANISELVRIRAEEVRQRVERVKSAEMFRLRGELLPLVRLNRALELPAATAETELGARPMHIVVLDSAALRYGLVVDGTDESEEIVVKPLGRHLHACTCLAGATILGDGTVAPILDVSGVAAHVAIKESEIELGQDADASAGPVAHEAQAMLVVENQPDEPFAIPMQLVTRLERIPTARIDTVGGREVLQYRGGLLPLLRIDRLVAATPPAPTANVHVVVFSMAGREFGLIVPRLLDVHTLDTEIDTEMFREPGVMGSTVFQGKTVRLLDPYELVETACPNAAIRKTLAEDEDAPGPPRILVVEDSKFFRQQMVKFLRSTGAEVIDAVDGEDAWQQLQDEEGRFDIIITDVEMPRLDGLGLTRRIKQDTRYRAIPVVAVTSLSSAGDLQRGQDAGVDAYHVKLEREQLLATIQELTRREFAPAAS